MTNFDPLGFYYIAQKIYNDCDKSDFAALRTCIGRAYYATFLVASQKAKTVDNNNVHRKTIDYFQNKKQALTSNRLKALLEKRHLADYDLAAIISKSDAGEALKISKAVLEALGKKIE
jgi:hypothetical protein